VLLLAMPFVLRGQSAADSVPGSTPAVVPAPVSDDPLSKDRIMGVSPNFQTVPDPTTPYRPLRVRDKWMLFIRETVDPYTFASSAAGAALSQWHNTAPQYGVGTESYLQRFGAAQADVTTQNFFSDAVLASLLHEDPRYFRMGPSRTVPTRIWYALTRIAITRKDTGKDGFSFSGIGGMGLGIGLSNAYYPPKSVNGDEIGSRFITSVTASALGNLLPEFWPDVKAKLDRLRHR
jgi:hypothetical protein